MKFLLLMTALTAAVPAPSKTDAGDLLSRVQGAYRNAGDMTASFKQTYTDALRHKQKVETGKLWVKKDGRVRFSYLQPERKDFVFDGKTAYFYEPENAQVTVFDRFADSPLASAMQFLWGHGDIASHFAAQPCAANCPAAPAGEIGVFLQPKEPMPSVDHVVMMVDPKAQRVRRSLVFDPLGNNTEYAFTEVQFGANIDAEKFNFTMPSGVSLLRTTTEGSTAPQEPNTP